MARRDTSNESATQEGTGSSGGDWTGRKVEDRDGSKLGRLEHVYLDHGTNRPTWGIVKAGRKHHFVPLHDASAGEKAIQVPADKSHVRAAPTVPADRELSPDTESRLSDHYRRRGELSDTRERQREEHGGFNIGAAFFGWLVALALAALLVALLSAIASAIGFSIDLAPQEARQSADTIGIVGGALLIAVLAVAYFGGGYVAGRMSRFDGARQGLGVWLFGLVVSIVLVVVGLIFGSEYNLLQQVNVPTVPIPTDSLTVGGIIALAAILIATILAAILGGKAGERYHRKVDRAGVER
jgi:sporulation protein YlmC with PRC-barrel domain